MAGELLTTAMSIASMFGAKGVAKAKSGLADAQYARAEAAAKWNEKEIQKAFEENYKNTSYAYGQKIRDIGLQSAQAQSELVTTVASNIANADMAESSFYNTAKLEADSEFDEAIQNTLANQSQALMGLAKERDVTSLQNATSLSDALFQSQNAKIQSGYELGQTYMKGVAGAAIGAAGLLESASSGGLGGIFKGSGAATSGKQGVSNTASKASGWIGALQSNQGTGGGYLTTNFKYGGN